ncbi:hypothetical protein [Colwellia maritima]|nr:hypothetical protein [Colwellia maritima]
MSNNHDTAMQFFDACETGKGGNFVVSSVTLMQHSHHKPLY